MSERIIVDYRWRPAGSRGDLLAATLCDGCKVAEAAQEHGCHPRKQQRADLEACKGIHAAKPREYGDCAQKHADGTVNPTDPQEQVCHA